LAVVDVWFSPIEGSDPANVFFPAADLPIIVG
jgi:hypothetical protein